MMGNINRENDYKNALINSGAIGFLTHSELKRLFMFVMRVEGACLSSFPGKYSTERATGLSHRLIEKTDIKLALFGLVLYREKEFLPGARGGGNAWKYFLNPIIPNLNKENVRQIRKNIKAEGSHLMVPVFQEVEGSHQDACLTYIKDSHFWVKRQSLYGLKAVTSPDENADNLKNLKEPTNNSVSITEKRKYFTDAELEKLFGKIVNRNELKKFLSNLDPGEGGKTHRAVGAWLNKRYPEDGWKVYTEIENELQKC